MVSGNKTGLMVTYNYEKTFNNHFNIIYMFNKSI